MKSFKEQCYELTKQVPKGKVTTYQAIAIGLGTRAYRAVGTAMRTCPYSLDEVPCHRVINSNGKAGKFESCDKAKMLESEGIEITNGKVKDFKKRLIEFAPINL